MKFEWEPWARFAVALLIAAVVVFALWLLLHYVIKVLRAKHGKTVDAFKSSRKYLIILAGFLGLMAAVATEWPGPVSRSILIRILVILSILTAAAFATSIVSAIVKQVRLKHPIQGDNDQDAMRLHTQLSIIRAFSNAAIWLIAIGISLFTIPGAHAIGTSLLASAGLASVVIGIAAQSVLGNVFAGLQIALSGSVRVGDMIVADTQQGRIESINLTTVVMRVWDERRVVFPTSYFTTTPFENWTIGTKTHIGAIRFDLDWRVDPAEVKTQLEKILKNNDLWDGKSANVSVEDATGGMVRLLVTASSNDEDSLVKLRNEIRAGIVEWLVANSPESLPLRRTLSENQS